ncbi:MAG: FdtA/QdtA family cupin domain-containing protein [Phycisphaerae bacterium]|nr:FdtA/QdtA family cupin domain-containing protein [Phycisphaerae bacterium]
MSIYDCKIMNISKINDPRGNLSFIESGRPAPFAIRRVYWIYDVPGGEVRGGHAYKKLQEFFVALSGSFDVVLNDGQNTKVVPLNRSYFGLWLPNMIWRRLENFSTNAVCLILASMPYTEDDYFRDFKIFQKAKMGGADDNCR